MEGTKRLRYAQRNRTGTFPTIGEHEHMISFPYAIKIELLYEMNSTVRQFAKRGHVMRKFCSRSSSFILFFWNPRWLLAKQVKRSQLIWSSSFDSIVDSIVSFEHKAFYSALQVCACETGIYNQGNEIDSQTNCQVYTSLLVAPRARYSRVFRLHVRGFTSVK